MDGKQIPTARTPPKGDPPAEGGVPPNDPHDEDLDEPVLGEEGLLELEGKQPLEYSDPWITRKVEGALAAHRKVRARSTEVATDHGVVTLRGKVETEAEKRLASLAAQGIEGVLNVDNQMVVAGNREA